MSEWESGISPAKMRQGMREANSFCHCGKLRARHTPFEVKICKMEQRTETVLRQMTDKDIQNMRGAKI